MCLPLSLPNPTPTPPQSCGSRRSWGKGDPFCPDLCLFPWWLLLLALQPWFCHLCEPKTEPFFGRNNKQYYTTCYFEKKKFFFFLASSTTTEEEGGWDLGKFSAVWPNSQWEICVQVTGRRKVNFSLAWHLRICRIFHRQRRGLVYFCPYLKLYELIVLFYTVTTDIMQCTVCFFYFIKGNLI